MNYAKLNKLAGMLLFIDFEKAFDSLNWNFMMQALKCVNFGPKFIKWIKVIYTDISSCIINNGKTGKYFPVARGVRQGDPLSPYLFILVTEFLANRIRSNNDIKGFIVNKNEIKITMYADDTTAFLADKQSAKCLFAELDQFRKASGLKINMEKTEGLWLGSKVNSKENPFGITWSSEPIKALGIYFSYDTKAAENANFADKIKQLERQLHWWKARDLSLMGRILIVKTLGLSKFSFLASVVHTPGWVIKRVNSCIFHYIWKGKSDKVKRDIMIQDYHKGGYNMVDLQMVVHSAQLDWIKRFLNNNYADWKILMSEFCKKENLNLFLQGNFDEFEIPTDTPQYYLDTIKTWRYFKYDYIIEQKDLNQQLIWYNKNIKIRQETIYSQRLFACGLWVLSDLFENGTLIPFNIWIKRGALPRDIMMWMGLVESLPQFIKTFGKSVHLFEKTNFNTRVLTSQNKFKSIFESQQKDIKDIIRIRKFTELTDKDYKAKEKYNTEFRDLTDKHWENIFTLPIRLSSKNNLKEMQFKIIHRIFPVKLFLYKIKRVDSPKCSFCEIQDETLEHLFVNCHVIKHCWLQLLSLWKTFGELT